MELGYLGSESGNMVGPRRGVVQSPPRRHVGGFCGRALGKAVRGGRIIDVSFNHIIEDGVVGRGEGVF